MHRGRLHGRSRLTSILRAPGSLYPPAVYPPDTTLTAAGHPTLNSDPRPGYLAEITDSTWGTKVRRISNNNLYRNQYSTHQSWNLDGTRIMFPGYGGRILDGSTYADLGAFTGWADMIHWSNTNADYAFGTKYWDNRVRRYSVSGNSWSDLHTFSGYGSLDLGGYSGNVSDNDRIAIAYCTTDNHDTGTWGIVVYDCATDTVVSSLELGATSAYWPSSVIISRSGDYVIVFHPTNGAGANQGTKLYAAADMSYVRHITNGRPHSDAGRNAAGEDIFVFISDDTDPEGGNNVRSHRLSDGTEFSIFADSGIYGIGHISCANYERPGWVYLNSNNITLPNVNGFQQIIAAKTDGTETVEVFAFHHSTADPNVYYDATPLASVSRDGTRVIWGSSWGGNPASEVYCFVAGVTT